MQELFLLNVGTKMRKVNNCEDCGKVLVDNRSKKCGSCNQAGKTVSEKTKEKMRGKNNYIWKGNDVQYRALHLWVKRNKQIVERCEKCNEIKKLCIANISGKYKRDVNDFEWLCYSCHNKKDMIGLNFHKKLNRNTYTIQKEVQ